MTSTVDTEVVQPPGAGRLEGARLRCTIAAMVLAPWGFVVANAGFAWIQLHGGRDEPGTAVLAMVDAFPLLSRVIITAVLLGCLLVVPAVLGVMHLVRRSWPAFVGGSLMVAGYVCYFGVIMTNALYVAMAEGRGPRDVYADVIDRSEAQGWTTWVFLLFVLGNLVGTALLAVGLLRVRTVPRWAGFGLLAWPVLHVTGLLVGSEVLEVVGALAQAAAFAGLATLVRAGGSRGARTPDPLLVRQVL